MNETKENRTNYLLGGLIFLTGISGALAGSLYLMVLHFLQHYLWPGEHTALVQGFMLTGVGLAAAFIIDKVGNPGSIDVLVDNIHVSGESRDFRSLRSLIPVSLLCISAGAGVGPEAPLVQTTGLLGSYWGRLRKLTPIERRILTITGMSTGFSILFGAPIGAAIFALEFLHQDGIEYYEAILPAIWGALCGYIFHSLLTGASMAPAWNFFPEATATTSSDILWSAVVGVISAVIATVFAWNVRTLRAMFLKLNVYVRLTTGGLALGLLGAVSPFALTFGEAQVEHLLAPEVAFGFLLVALLAKYAGTTISICAGWRGGFIIPLFFMGCALGRMLHILFPSANEVVLMAGLMAGINAGATRTPLGSTLVVTRMANLHILPTTLLSAMIASALTRRLRLIGSKRSREDGEQLNGGGVLPKPSVA